jgi:hypothetical protein
MSVLVLFDISLSRFEKVSLNYLRWMTRDIFAVKASPGIPCQDSKAEKVKIFV